MKRFITIVSFVLCPLSIVLAQKEAGDVRRGNREYRKQNFTEAEVDYRRGLEANKDSYEAHYNLGDALFKQDKYTDAQLEFETAAKMLDKKADKDRYAKVMHNIGNCTFAQQQYDKAVAAYQESLRANPKDNNNSKTSKTSNRTNKISNRTNSSNSSSKSNKTRWTKRRLSRFCKPSSKTNKIPKRKCSGSKVRNAA